MSANLGTNICLRGKQALPGSAINRIIRQTVMSWITANYDKICFGICLRGSGEFELAQEFRAEQRSGVHLNQHCDSRAACATGDKSESGFGLPGALAVTLATATGTGAPRGPGCCRVTELRDLISVRPRVREPC